MSFPDGFLLDDLIVYPNAVSRGYELSLPDLREAHPSAINEYSTTWEKFALSLTEDIRVSFQTDKIADFHSPLGRYAQATASISNAWTRRVREERHARYTERMRAGQLARQRTILFFSVRLEDMPDLFSSPFHLEERYHRLLGAAKARIQQAAEPLSRSLASHGGYLTPMTDADHHRHFARFLNPSLATRPGFDPMATFDPARSIHSNCWWSEAAGRAHDIFMDGHYHAFRGFTRWSAQLTQSSLLSLWELPGPNHRVTVNARCLNTRELIAREERELRRLESQMAAERRPSLLPAIEKKRMRIEHLASGFLKPFATEIIVHTWATTQEALALQCSTVEQAIQVSGAQFYAATLPTTSKRLFAQTWPGYPWGGYQHYQLYSESSYLPFLFPLLAVSFVGYLNEAEALLESPHGCPLGLRMMSGGQPMHLVICAGTGGGKSMLWGEVVSQIASFFGSIVFIDFGGTHETLARVLDPLGRSIVLHPNSGIRINYADTCGLPATNDYFAEAATFITLACGSTANEREDRRRRVAVTEGLSQLHTARFNQLERNFPERALAVARHALALRRRGDRNSDPLEVFVDFRDWQSAHPDEAQCLLAQFSEGQAVSFLKDPATRPEAVRLASALWTPSEQPTHRELQEWMHLRATATRDPIVIDLADVMKDLCQGGAAGMFDGVSNVDLARPVLHLELGRLDPRNPALSGAAGYLAFTLARRRNLALPRGVRKLLTIEETSAFLAFLGREGEAWLRRELEQGRKFNTVIATVFQNYSRLRELPICPTLLSNAQQFLLMKQDGRPDLKLLVEDLGLPASMIDTMSQFPRPAVAGYADFTLYCRDTPHPVCGVARHIPSREMMYVTCSTPAHIEARQAALRGEGEILARIQQAVS